MKTLIAMILAVTLLVTLSGMALAAKPDNDCTTIKDGLTDSYGDPLVLGYDQYGYNYQAHMFSGRYCDYDRVIGGDYCDVQLIMKWNDAWLSNKSCDDDLLLDRPASYIGSGAWCTNHMWGSYEEDGKTCYWVYFVKMVAVPEDAELVAGIWYTAEGTEIGPEIWGAFATIQQVYNDQGTGEHGIEYLSPAGPGFGKWK
ncbi:hypothetical protein ES703_123600 [subsurface metagenome]